MYIFSKKLSVKGRLAKMLATAFLLLILAFSCVFGGISLRNITGAKAEVAGSNVIKLTPNDGVNVFDSDAVHKLYESLTGTPRATLQHVKDLVSGTQRYGADETDSTKGVDIPAIVTAEGIRGTNGSDLTVTFGAYDWTVTSLTRSTGGDPILTLYLAPGQSLDHPQSIFAGNASASYSDTTKNGWWNKDANPTYMSNGYATSFIRNVVLNAGKSYATSNAANALKSATQSTSNDFAQYTMPTAAKSLTQYIVKPSQVKYQEIEANAVSLGNWNSNYILKNDAYGTPASGTWYSGHDMTSKIGKDEYSGWKDDYIWLPSITETGAENLTSYGTGIWELSKTQRSNPSSTSYTWLRSGYHDYFYGSYILDSSGSYYYGNVDYPYAVRPALHLNLAAVAAEANKLDLMSSDSGKTFDKTALDMLIERLTDKAGATFADLKAAVAGEQDYGSTTIPTLVTASQIKANGGYDLKVKFGDYYWDITSLTTTNGGDPIVTLYLEPGETLTNPYSVFAGTSSTSYADPGSYGWAENIDGMYISNVYGTSFIRNVTLNAGGQWATSASTVIDKNNANVGKNADNDFAQYTMDTVAGSLTKYIAKPSQVKYQEIENVLKSIPGYQDYTIKNEAYGTPDGAVWYEDGNGVSHDMTAKYTDKTTVNSATGKSIESEYTGWKDDYIWLPSMTETGADSVRQGKGIWGLSTAQRSNPSVSDYTWLRSGSESTFGSVFLLNSSGNGGGGGAGGVFAVRPALHLNLATAMCEANGGHTEGAWITDTEPTCTEAGTKHTNCTICGEVLQNGTIDPTGHNYSSAPEFEWTDTTATATFTCSDCLDGTDGHTYTKDATITNAPDPSRPATCGEKGWTVYMATASATTGGTEYTDQKSVQDIPANGHTEVTDAAVAPTCTETGLSEGKHCSVCNTVTQAQEEIPAKGHNWSTAWSEDDTEHWHACTVCGAKNENAAHVEEIDAAVAATCTTAGLTEGKHCSVCNKVIVAQQTVAAKGHTLNPWQHDENEHWQICSTCNQKVEEAGHSWSNWEITKQPTTEETGEKKCSCSVCGLLKTEKIAKLVQDEGGNSVTDLPILDDPNSNYELEITVEATNTVYTLEGTNKGFKVQLWIVGGASKVEYDKTKELTLSLIVPADMEEFVLYKLVAGGYEPIDSSAYTVESGVLSIRTTLPEEFIFNQAPESAGMPWWVWLVIVLGVVLVAVIIVIIVVKTRKKPDPVIVQGSEYDDAALRAQLAAQNKRIEDLENRDDGGFNDPYDGEL